MVSEAVLDELIKLEEWTNGFPGIKHMNMEYGDFSPLEMYMAGSVKIIISKGAKFAMRDILAGCGWFSSIDSSGRTGQSFFATVEVSEFKQELQTLIRVSMIDEFIADNKQ